MPFQIWVPDVYQGAPTPVTAFLSVGSKAAGFVVLLRVLAPFSMFPQVGRLLVGVAALTLIYGNFAALPQIESQTAARLLQHRARGLSADRRRQFCRNGGRLLSRRVFAHDPALFRRAIVVGKQRRRTDRRLRGPCQTFAVSRLRDADRDDFARRSAFTAGFLGKFFIFDAAIRQHQTFLVVIGVITVGCGFYYYLKVVRAMYWLAPRQDRAGAVELALSPNDDHF